MTKQQRLTIRAELARRMGIPESEWTATCWAQKHIVDGISEDSYCRDCDGLVMNQAKMPPDPFTNAADKDALVAWLAADWVLWKRFFLEFTALIIPAMMQSEDYLGRIGETDNYTIGPSKAEWGWALMTAPREAITLAAAKALGIGEAEGDTK